MYWRSIQERSLFVLGRILSLEARACISIFPPVVWNMVCKAFLAEEIGSSTRKYITKRIQSIQARDTTISLYPFLHPGKLSSAHIAKARHIKGIQQSKIGLRLSTIVNLRSVFKVPRKIPRAATLQSRLVNQSTIRAKIMIQNSVDLCPPPNYFDT
jgi:hypothetical protein